MSKEIELSLESITVRGKYEIPETDFDVVYKKVMKELHDVGWQELTRIGESIRLMAWKKPPKRISSKLWQKYINGLRSGIPVFL